MILRGKVGFCKFISLEWGIRKIYSNNDTNDYRQRVQECQVLNWNFRWYSKRVFFTILGYVHILKISTRFDIKSDETARPKYETDS